MASRRAIVRLSLRSSASAIIRKPLSVPQTSLHQGLRAPVLRAGATQFQQIRWHSAPPSNSKVYNYEQVHFPPSSLTKKPPAPPLAPTNTTPQVKAIVESPSDDTVLIDVREPSEYEAGYIPTALNIPISSQPDALFLSSEEFQDRFGFIKPPPQKTLVFYCKAGVRSSAAAQLALQHGYEKVGEYRGVGWIGVRGGEESGQGPKGHKGGKAPV
ncbi:hypothetical protein H2199_007699 [Coniosporium tulheliwenetii]|uniref:Uncharacterized protein n=1 Tax=Coniosporium tulheliwenetii TaxID=3383036 RepID=A0ACC2YNV3_9PEZI|nr:hypothetical protein H2199_007699 [Cladosporium sp. JES 115]